MKIRPAKRLRNTRLCPSQLLIHLCELVHRTLSHTAAILQSATCQQSRASMRPLSTLRRSFLSHISKPVWYFAKRRVLLSDHRLPCILIMLTSACNEWYRVLFWYIIYKYVYNHQHYTWNIYTCVYIRYIRHALYCIYVQ